MSTLEDRLQAELRAESELIESVPELSLPAAGRAGRRTRRRWPGWVTPLAATAAVLAVVAGTRRDRLLEPSRGAQRHYGDLAGQRYGRRRPHAADPAPQLACPRPAGRTSPRTAAS